MVLTQVSQDEEPDEDAEETQQSTIDNYTGVSIKVPNVYLIMEDDLNGT
jgi:structural maintenance of chromosome 3 (chondroitin sulfate proteoglycan 6)